jgi:two-component system, NtrC family, sensor histidine kinase HydH
VYTPNGSIDYSDKVLIVDQDPSVCEALAQTLKGAGYEPEVHLHPRTALSLLSTGAFSLAFIEVDLPETSGFELAESFRQSGLLEEIIFMAKDATFEHVVRAIKIGAYDFLQKPFDSNELGMLLMRLRERRRLQRRLAQAQVRYQSLIQSVPVLIFSLSSDYELRFINQACTPLLGYTPEEAMATPGWFLATIHPQERGRVRETLAISFSQAAPSSLECRMLHKKGAEIHGILRTMPGQDEEHGSGDHLLEVEGIFVDITDRVFLEKALVQNEKLKTLGAISAEMAHEVRNPLMSIAGFARRLEKKAPDMPEVGIILRESMRLERLLNRIRDYLKPVEARPRECAVNSVLGESLGLLYQEMTDRGVWCKLERIQEAPMVVADPDYLSQVFVNLIRNALMTLERDSVFLITSYESNENIHLDFRMPLDTDHERNPEQLFMPFDEGGHSFGLPLCYRLVKDMGGLLSYSPEERHDVFTLSLPKFRQDARPSMTLGNGAAQQQDKYCFDDRTGALPRRHFEDIFQRIYNTALRDGQPLALLMADVDRFEEYARSHGDRAAQECVLAIGRTFARVLSKPQQLLCMHGANEFMILLPDTAEDEALEIAEKLRMAVHALNLPHQGGTEHDTVTVSIGLAGFIPNHSLGPSDLMAAVSKALFLAKEQGRDTVHATHVIEPLEPS